MGTLGVTPPTQVPRWHVPEGIELHGVESGKNCGDGQLPLELQETVSSQSLSLPHTHSSCCACLYVQNPSDGYSSPSLR